MLELRLFGVLFGLAALGLVWVARFRWQRLRNLEWLLGSLVAGSVVALGLFPDAANAILAFFSFEKGGGQRILGLLIFFVLAQYVLTFVALARSRRLESEIDRLVRELAKQDYRRKHGAHDASIYVVISAYNEADNIEPVLARVPKEVLGLRVRPLVVVDGATDRTQQVVERMNHAAVAYTVNRGGGAALKAGYEIALEDDAEIVVTLDADGQHSPEEIERLVKPILDGTADLVNGSRVLGTYEKDSQVRAAGVVVFNWLISLLTLTRITDCSNAFRAIRVSELGKLRLRQSQFHSSEMLIEALKHGLRVVEVPITITRRMSGESKKGMTLTYGWGFARAIVTTWLR
jgi:cellulose synthase/poly-beta-1,6-N-acetylglucosamine synthase-like glycosyltransferase